MPAAINQRTLAPVSLSASLSWSLEQGVGVDDLRHWCARRAAAVARTPGWVLASLKWATAKIERTSQRGNGERHQDRERQAERGGDFNGSPPF